MTDRRDFIKQAIGWTAFALADQWKLVPAAPKVAKKLTAQASLEKILAERLKARCPLSSIIGRGVVPKGIGFNFSAEFKREIGQESFKPVSIDGEYQSASTSIEYNFQQTALLSEVFHRGMTKDQRRCAMMNLADNLIESLEQKDIEEYARLCGNKIILDERLTSDNRPMPLCRPTRAASIGALDEIYLSALRVGMEPEIIIGDCPVFLLLCSPEAHVRLVREWKATGHEGIPIDLHKVEEPVRTFLKLRGATIAYGGFVHCAINMPRWDFVAGAWERRLMFTDHMAHVSMAHVNANFEDLMIFDRSVMERLLTEDEPSIYGRARWVKLDDGYAQYVHMQQAWRPISMHNGYVIRAKRIVPMRNAAA